MNESTGLHVVPRYERIEGCDEVVAWEVWDGDDWLQTFDNETDAIDFRADVARARKAAA